MMSDPGDELSELGIFGEHTPSNALLLWNVARDLVLWGMTPPDVRVELFAPGAGRERLEQVAGSGLPRDVTTWLEILVAILHAPKVRRGDGGVTEVCQRLAQWAAASGKADTALAFAQAAAVAEPMDARAAVLVGETAAAFGRLQRAESWLQRAVAIGRTVKDWRSYTASHVGLGEIALHSERARDAEGKFRRALRSARRYGLTVDAARAMMGLLRVAIRSERWEDALRWEARAARAVRRSEAGAAALVAASVDLWMGTGDFNRALQCLKTARLDADTPAKRMGVVARVARASAGIDDADGLSEAWAQAWEMAQDILAPAEARFRTYLELFHAAVLAGDHRRAGQALRSAEPLAASAYERTQLEVAKTLAQAGVRGG